MNILSFVRRRGARNDEPAGLPGMTACRRLIGRRAARLLADEDGGPLVELGFVLPIMALLLTGMFTFGVAIYNAINLTQATGQGALYLQQVATTTADPCADALSAIEKAAPNLKSTSVTISLSLNGGSTTTGSSCGSLASSFNSATSGSYFTLTAKYPCALAAAGLNLGGCQLQGQSAEYLYY